MKLIDLCEKAEIIRTENDRISIDRNSFGSPVYLLEGELEQRLYVDFDQEVELSENGSAIIKVRRLKGSISKIEFFFEKIVPITVNDFK